MEPWSTLRGGLRRTAGHHRAAITVYDPWTAILLTGDTVFPGRLYVSDRAAFVATMNRLVAFAGTRPVTHVLGCHVEMTGHPGRSDQLKLLVSGLAYRLRAGRS